MGGYIFKQTVQADEPLNTNRQKTEEPLAQIRGTQKDNHERIAFQALTGDWSYTRNGKEFSYIISFYDGQYTFEQRDTGAGGILINIGNWFQGDVKIGDVRLMPLENGTLLSEFRVNSEGSWSTRTIASRTGTKEDASCLQRMHQYAAISDPISSIADVLQVQPIAVLSAGALFALCFIGFGFCGEMICNIAGFGYPAFESFKCLQQQDWKMEFWLQYWTVFAVFALLENFTYYIVVWIPFYYPVKLCLRRNLIDNAIRTTAREAKNTLGSAAVVGGALNAGVAVGKVGRALLEDQRPNKRPRTDK